MVQVGENAFMHEEDFRMVCERLLNSIQVKFWGKKIIDCDDNEYQNGLVKYLANNFKGAKND